MNLSVSSIRSAIAAVTFIAVAAGCSGSDQHVQTLLPMQPALVDMNPRPQFPWLGYLPPGAHRQVGPVAITASVSSFMSKTSPFVPLVTKHLFISDDVANKAYVFTYPGGVPVPTATVNGLNMPSGECVNPMRRFVYITNSGGSNIYVVTWGGTVVAILPDRGHTPVSCSYSVLRRTLAVANLTSTGPASIAIYPGGSGSPTYHTDPAMTSFYFMGYASNGMLYIDGFNAASTPVFQVERFAPNNVFATMALAMGSNPAITFPGNVQWDGTNLAIGDQTLNVFYPFAIAGLGATAGTQAPFTGACDVVQFVINAASTKVVGPDQCGTPPNAYTYPYPAGGASVAPFITAPLALPIGSAIVN